MPSFAFSVPGRRGEVAFGEFIFCFNHVGPVLRSLVRKPSGDLERLPTGGFLRTEDDLRHTFASRRSMKDDAMVITIRIHPSGERDGLADIGLAELIAMVRAIHDRGADDTRKRREWEKILRCRAAGSPGSRKRR